MTLPLEQLECVSITSIRTHFTFTKSKSVFDIFYFFLAFFFLLKNKSACRIHVFLSCIVSSQQGDLHVYLHSTFLNSVCSFFSESTIIVDQSTMLIDRTLIGPEDCVASQPVHTDARFYCQDCEPNTKEHSCPISSSSCTTVPRPSEPGDPGISTIYSRVRKRKTHQGESGKENGSNTLRSKNS